MISWSHEEWRKRYSDLLYDTAARWGVPVPPAGQRPNIDDDDLPVARLPVIETLKWQSQHKAWHYVELDLAVYNGLWGFASRGVMSGPRCGWAYSALMKFCEPYPARAEALAAGAAWILDHIPQDHPDRPAISRWLAGIQAPAQLALF